MQNTLIHKKISNRTKESFGDMVFLVIAYSILILLAFCCMYPLYFTVIASVSDAYNVYRSEVFLLPKEFNFNAYVRIFQYPNFLRAYGNTFIYTIGGTGIAMVMTCLMALPANCWKPLPRR